MTDNERIVMLARQHAPQLTDDVIRLIAERDAARAEVARVTELAITERDSAAREIERLTAALKDAEKMARVIEGLDEYSFDSDGQFFAVDFGDETIHPDSLIARFRAAMRGDTAPAGGEARP